MTRAAALSLACACALGACSRAEPEHAPTPVVSEPAPIATSLPADSTRDVVLGRCVICHDESYLAQQRLSVEAWTKTVTKMQGFGAPIGPDDIAPIAAYLARTYALSAPDIAPALVAKPPEGLASQR